MQANHLTKPASRIRRGTTVAIAAALVAIAVAVACPEEADAGVTFGDGVRMFVQIDCDFQGFNTTVYNSSPTVSYARTYVWSHQTGRWINNPPWYSFGNAFTHTGWEAWPYGRGTFTLRSQVGRYVNGRWVTGWEMDYTCYFVR